MKAHRTDGVSLTFALIFLAATAWWLFAQLMHLTLPAVGWLVAAGLIGVGVLGLIGALRAHRSGRQPTPAPAATGSPVAPTDAAVSEPVPTDGRLDTLFDPDQTARLDPDQTAEFDRDDDRPA